MPFAQFSVKSLTAYYLIEGLYFEYELTLCCRYFLPTCYYSQLSSQHHFPYKNLNISYGQIYQSPVDPGAVTDLGSRDQDIPVSCVQTIDNCNSKRRGYTRSVLSTRQGGWEDGSCGAGQGTEHFRRAGGQEVSTQDE